MEEEKGWSNSPGISESEEYWWTPTNVKLSFCIASLKNISGSETVGYKGDEGFPLVPILSKATITFWTTHENVVYQIYWFFHLPK